MGNEQQPKKKHTGLIVVIVILVILVLGGLASCYACGAAVDAVDEELEGETADSVTSDGSSGSDASEDADDEGDAIEAVVLYDDNDITISATERGEDITGAYYTIEIVNDSDSSITVDIDEVSVDGAMADVLFAETVSAGKTSSEQLSLYDVDSMDDLVNVEGSIYIYDADTYNDIADTTFTID